MGKTKKLLSLVTSVAMTASAFSALVIPAHADTPVEPYAELTLTVPPEEATTAVAIKAQYDEDNRLTVVELSDIEIEAGQETVLVEAPIGTKVMLWDSLTGMNPLAVSATSEDHNQTEPTGKPTEEVTEAPTEEATEAPTEETTEAPTEEATEAPTEETTEAPTEETTEAPTEETTEAPTEEATDEPTEEAAVYIDENFDSYTAGTIISSTGSDVDSAPDSVTMGSVVYNAGHRNNGSINDSASITADGTNMLLTVSSDGYATNSRGISMTFAETAGIPAVESLGTGCNLELSMDVSATNAFGITGFGNITTADLGSTDTVHLRAVIDKANSKQYVISTNSEGTVLASSVSDLTATGFTGMTFFVGSGTYKIDNLKVETKTPDVGVVSAKVLNGSEALEGATVAFGTYSVATGSDGTATAALPNGEYTVTASKSGYEHTAGMADNDTKTITVNSDVQSPEFTLSVMNYVKIPDTVTIEGGDSFIAAPKTDDTSTTAAFTVSVLDQYGLPMTSDEYTTTWSIYPTGTDTADANVTIDESGVVSVSKAFSTENKIANYDVTVVVATDDRNQKVTKTLVVGNNDITYYEALGWAVSNGTRTSSTTLKEAVSLTDLISVTLNMSMNYTEGNSNLCINSDAGKLVGIQHTGTTLTAWTAWTGNSNMNQSSDTGAFTNSVVLTDSYTDGDAVDITFVIDPSAKTITVSMGSATASLPYTIEATSITGLQMGQYRTYGGLNVNTVMVQEPDENYLNISGDLDFAKVSGTTVTRQYALGQSVLVDGETFTWAVSPADSGVTIDENGLLSVADTAAAGTYTITATSDINTAKTASLDVAVGDFETFTNSQALITGAQAYQYGTDTTDTYSITKLIDSYGDDVASLVPAAVWTSSDENVIEITSDGAATVKGAGTATITATITNGTAVSALTVPVTVGAYYIVADATGDSTTVDTSALVTSDAITGYLVTTATSDGTQVSSNVATELPTTVDTTGADKVEITPVFSYAIGEPGTLDTVGEGYDIAIPAGTYNFTITDTGGRCDVYANSQILVNNILQGGSTVNSLDVKDIKIPDGVAKISTTDVSGTENISVKVSKAPSIVNRTKKMYVLGDSLVCIYYNGGSATSNVQTGWGQVLSNYVTGVDVVDLANSGATAAGLIGTAFTQVLQSAESGDYLILESGYNDRTYNTAAEMEAAVTGMVTAAKEMGLNVVCVTPNASAHDYKSGVAWSGNMADYAAEAGAECVRLDTLSYDFLYGLYGDDYSTTAKSIYNVSDGLHSTYNGANKWASMVAGKLIDYGYSDVVNAEYKYSFEDGLGNTIECQAVATATDDTEESE